MYLVSKMRSTLPSRVAHDAPVAGRVELVGGEERGRARRSRSCSASEPLDLLGRDERMVAGEHHDRAVALAEHGLPRGEHGGPGALALALLGHLDVVRQPLGHPITGPHDRNHPPGAGRPRGIGNPLDERLAATR